ncbi:MAG: phosphoribosylanthranilate isomerase [Halioglobus sp.]
MTHTRIKICGITRPEDAQVAVECGTDAIGLVFYPDSPRAVSVEQAVACTSMVPPFVSVVALFVNESATVIRRILSSVPVDVIQFHGDESEAFCAQFDRPYIKALRVKSTLNIEAESGAYTSARGLLLDTWQDGVPGGTGKTFDWNLAAGEFKPPIVLAGGLKPGNVSAAIEQVRPAAVDVSGGVESEPGIKSPKLIREFIAAVRAADQSLQGKNHD